MANQEQVNILMAMAHLSQKYANNDLFKFWTLGEHRMINKFFHYFPIYEKWFKDFRGKDLVFVEIGVDKGGSLQMWKNYFGEKAKIVGIDINENCKKFEEEQISVEIGSQEDENFWTDFKQKYPRVDILLDDGGHEMNQQIVTFRQMFPHIKDGGIYMCEDCHTSYWPEYKGGLHHPDTYIEFAKALVDVINAFHTGEGLKPNYFTVNMGGIHFYDSIVIVEKSFVPLLPFGQIIGQPESVEN